MNVSELTLQPQMRKSRRREVKEFGERSLHREGSGPKKEENLMRSLRAGDRGEQIRNEDENGS